jgi:hypothetical protein
VEAKNEAGAHQVASANAKRVGLDRTVLPLLALMILSGISQIHSLMSVLCCQTLCQLGYLSVLVR